jgi:hypothetical protein
MSIKTISVKALEELIGIETQRCPIIEATRTTTTYEVSGTERICVRRSDREIRMDYQEMDNATFEMKVTRTLVARA